MSSITVTMVAFACTFGGPLLGLFIHRRLTGHHVSSESNDVIKLVMGLIVSEQIASNATKDGQGLATAKPLQAQRDVGDLIDRIATLSPKTMRSVSHRARRCA